ncbi:hypothetical protein BLNAU_17691 [Blattamonas nauphoetae]|uniref:Uncharacterized protein n=1 Tax=Blattamonas nauphoetae TaxID=2049346 RepID=A0ABQ9X6G5_9EUKA|nr:hypothetical protein BLNAU_17691 [Blattamonas nauphoetae]
MDLFFCLRAQPAIWTKTIEIDGDERDLLLVCADISETDESMLTVDRMIVASEYSPDQKFVFNARFSFPTSAFSKHPIGVVPSSVVVADGVASVGWLDEDELRPLWKKRKVSELAVDSSDSKYELQRASNQRAWMERDNKMREHDVSSCCFTAPSDRGHKHNSQKAAIDVISECRIRLNLVLPSMEAQQLRTCEAYGSSMILWDARVPHPLTQLLSCGREGFEKNGQEQ